jgi:hypothetical protein
MRVKVTKEHIKNGKRGSVSCPVALAIIDLCETGLCVAVGMTLVQIGDRDFVLPEEARRFINLFDNGGECTPIEFTMKEREPFWRVIN